MSSAYTKKKAGFFESEEGGDEIISPYQADARPTALIDIIFLLLVFFMCASSFPLLERRLDALLPKDKGMRATVAKQLNNLDETVIHVTAVGYGNGLRIPKFTIMGWTTSNPNELIAKLMQLQGVMAGTSQKASPRVVIAGKPDCPFMHVMTALDACAHANLTNVEFRPPMAGLEAGGSDSDHDQL
jgi:biopolymer transport protein ExbD